MYFDHIIPFSHIIYIVIRWGCVQKNNKRRGVCATAHVWRSEDSLEELLLSFHHMSPKDRTLSSGLGWGGPGGQVLFDPKVISPARVSIFAVTMVVDLF